jgi:pterin-4a-carbinolamine dehydratase
MAVASSRWRREGGALVRELVFRDSDEARACADDLAEQVDDYHRHPDLAIELNKLRIVIANLLHDGITLAEERLAANVDARLAERHPDLA